MQEICLLISNKPYYVLEKAILIILFEIVFIQCTWYQMITIINSIELIIKHEIFILKYYLFIINVNMGKLQQKMLILVMKKMYKTLLRSYSLLVTSKAYYKLRCTNNSHCSNTIQSIIIKFDKFKILSN